MADAQKALTRTLSLAGGLLLASCTSGPQAGWLFKTAREAALPGPIAVWGYPETTADLGFGCRNDDNVAFWLGSEAPLSSGKPVRFYAGTATADLPETFVQDGIGSSAFLIPAGSPLAAAIGSGATRLAWRLADGGRGSIALGPAVRQLFSACAAQSPR